ncbi:hypothetical protein AZE42_12985, partial [Rhizopogon vesiculosus]
MIPAYIAAASAFSLLLHFVLLSKPAKKIWSRFLPPTKTDEEPSAFSEEAITVDGFVSEAKAFLSRHGGLVIFAYKFTRFIGCLVFLALSLATFILEEREEHSVGTNKESGRNHHKTRLIDGPIPFSRA